MIRVRGEHDIATRDRLSVRLAEAAGRDHADVVIDLSGVTFMDASTIGVFVTARNYLGGRSRSLSFRDPSPVAQRLFDLCGLSHLIDAPTPVPSPMGTALGTWVIVPARDPNPVPGQPQVTPKEPAQEPATAAVGSALDPARSIRRRRAQQ